MCLFLLSIFFVKFRNYRFANGNYQMLFHFRACQAKPTRSCKSHHEAKPKNKHILLIVTDKIPHDAIVLPCGTGGGRLGGLAPPLKFPPNSSG